MSRAGKREDRAPLDFYGTPARLAAAICELLDRCGVRPELVIEPSAGHGAFVNAARLTWMDARIVAVEIDAAKRPLLKLADHVLIGDWVRVAPSISKRAPLLILGNPPYCDAEGHIRAALDAMAECDSLALLLRINFLGSHDRVALWRTPGLKHCVPVVPRPSFTLDGKTDGTEYAVLWWEKGFAGEPTIMPPLVWRAKGGRN